MAKVFDTEVLYVNDKNIQITATGDGEFDFLDSNNNLVFSKTGYDQSITSLSDDIYEKDVIVKSESIAAAASTKEIIFNTANFTAQPGVVGLMSSSAANDPVIDSQLLEVTASSAKFALSDDLPSSDYKINLLIKGTRSQSLWTPASLNNDLFAWYDPADTTTITTSSGGNDVTQLDDKSSNSLDLTVINTAKTGPDSGTRTFNSLNVLDFQKTVNGGTLNTLETNSLNRNINSNNTFMLTMLVYFDVDSHVKTTGESFEDQDFFISFNDNTISTRLGIRRSSGNTLQIVGGGGLNELTTGTTEGSAFLLTFDLRGSGGTSTMRRNGDVIAQNTSMSDISLPLINLGGNLNEDQGIDGFIGDVVMYSSASDISKVEGYVAHKWGLANKLPSSHSYKTNRPS